MPAVQLVLLVLLVPPIINSALSPPPSFLTFSFFPENIGRLPQRQTELATLVILTGLNPRTVPAVVDLLSQLLV